MSQMIVLSTNEHLKGAIYSIYRENINLFMDKSLKKISDAEFNQLQDDLDILINLQEQNNNKNKNNAERFDFNYVQNFLNKY